MFKQIQRLDGFLMYLSVLLIFSASSRFSWFSGTMFDGALRSVASDIDQSLDSFKFHADHNCRPFGLSSPRR